MKAKKTRFFVNPTLLLVALATWAILTISAVVVLPLGRYVSAAIFFLIGLLFLAVAVGNGIVVSVEPEGLARSVLGRRVNLLPWEQIRELGVCGTKPFHAEKTDRVGTLYIYAASEHLTDKERFDMVLRWPPKDKVYLLYSEERLTAIQLRWSGKITLYNSGSLRIG